MKSLRSATLLLALPLATALFMGCGKKTDEPAPPVPVTGSFALELEPVAGADPLQLNTQAYTKADGQTFTVSKFKFLVSNLKLARADGSSYAVPDGYYLIDASDSRTYHIVVAGVPLGDYTGLSFIVGVDAAHNNAAFTSGALNHSNDLYWEWSGEYVFLKMAGSSPQAPTGRGLTFDIGGANCARVVSPTFHGSILPIKDGHIPEIHIAADVKALFNSPTPARNVDFTTTYSVESGSAWAPTVADNYAAGMFSVEHIHAN